MEKKEENKVTWDDIENIQFRDRFKFAFYNRFSGQMLDIKSRVQESSAAQSKSITIPEMKGFFKQFTK